jgi:RES domain
VYADLLTNIADFDDDLLRNIKGIRRSQDLFDDLCDDPNQYAVAHAAECRDTVATDQRLLSRPFDYGTAVAFPFLSANWHRTRFSDGTRYGVWHGSQNLETTIYESAYHWRRLILASFPTETANIIGERRVVKVSCRGILVSLVGKETDWPALVDPIDYSFTNTLGSYLHDQGQNGLLVQSARYSGINAAILNQAILGNVRDHCFLTYTYDPQEKGNIRVEREQGTLLMTVTW